MNITDHPFGAFDGNNQHNPSDCGFCGLPRVLHFAQHATHHPSMEGNKMATKSARQTQLNREAKDTALAADRRTQEQNERNRIEARAAADQNQARAAADASTPRENDMVTLDIAGVPEALRTAPVIESLRGLEQAGMHGRSGRVTRFEDGPAGRMAVITGPDFEQKVPVLAIRKAGDQPKAPRKRTSAKKSAKKTSAKSTAKKTSAKKAASKK